MKRLLSIILLTYILPFQSLKANTDLPGFWNLGGSTGLVSIFAEDSLYKDLIQMQREEVHVLLYKGFTVVKATCYFKNLGGEDIHIRVGYPINSSFESTQVHSVHFMDLYELKVRQDSLEVKTKRLEKDDSPVLKDMGIIEEVENWYVWECEFNAGKTHQIEVYFIVNTNSGTLVKGYSRDYNNGFTYLLESGKIWAKKIEEGSFHIHLMDSLNADDILGITPNSFQLDATNKRLVYTFKDLEPDQNHNILVRYSFGDKDFDFQAVLEQKDTYFKQVDQSQLSSINSKNLMPFEAVDFKIHDWKGSTGFTMAMFVMVFGFPILIILIGLRIFISYIRKKKQS